VIKEAKQTVSWLWDVIRNPDVVWVDGNTGEEVNRERWKRSTRWHTLRPIWTFYVFTIRAECGCRKRFGLWHTIYCSKHCFPELEGNWNDREGG
jgi:hypothetical protein